MDTVTPDFSSLFAQLGLENSPEGIERFINQHPLAANVRIAEAAFWNDAQKIFIEEAIAEDAQWAEAIGHLDSALHQHH